MSVIFCCVLALLALLQTANCLNCYTCNTKENLACSWGGLSSFTYNSETCPSGGLLDRIISPKCYKITAESKDGREYIARGCLPAGVLACDKIASAVGWISSQTSDDGESLRNLNCNSCESDYCNSAQKFTGATVVGLFLAVAVFVI